MSTIRNAYACKLYNEQTFDDFEVTVYAENEDEALESAREEAVREYHATDSDDWVPSGNEGEGIVRLSEGPAVITDTEALDLIHARMSGQEWNPETLDAIALILTETGRVIADSDVEDDAPQHVDDHDSDETCEACLYDQYCEAIRHGGETPMDYNSWHDIFMENK